MNSNAKEFYLITAMKTKATMTLALIPLILLGSGCENHEEQLQTDLTNAQYKIRELEERVEDYQQALQEANDNIEEANQTIEDAQSYSGESCSDMEDALDGMSTTDTVTDPG